MKRRDFLVGTAGVVGVAGAAFAQAPAAPAQGQQGAQGRGGGGGGRGNTPMPAAVPAEKLARVALMQLQFGMYLRPNNPNATPTPEQTLTVFDLPKMYMDYYGVRAVEYQHGNIVQSETDPNFIKQLKAKLDEAGTVMSQINLEIGQEAISNADPAMRQKAIEHVKQWIDIASQYGCKRVMINQQQNMLTLDRKADAITTMKAMADYGRPKGVMISVETRGANPPMVDGKPAYTMKPWELMADIIEGAGANSNCDIGNVGAQNQDELHACIKRWYKTSSGNMHIKSSPFWSMALAVRYAESLGYRGRYSLEINQGGHPAIRLAYNEILANVTNTLDPKWA
jgi:sugar phosphate isomerase/epimerase